MKYRKVVPRDSHTKDGIAIIEKNKVLCLCVTVVLKGLN